MWWAEEWGSGQAPCGDAPRTLCQLKVPGGYFGSDTVAWNNAEIDLEDKTGTLESGDFFLSLVVMVCGSVSNQTITECG